MIRIRQAERQDIAKEHLSVTSVGDYQEFLALADEWSGLLENSDTNRVFLTHPWFRCWWDAFAGQGQMCILCVRRAGRLVGLAPLRIVQSTFRQLPVKRLGFMVNGTSPEADFITVSPGDEVRRALFAYLADNTELWDILDLQRLRSDSHTWRSIGALVRDAGFMYTTRPDKRVPYVPIEGDWDSFLARRSGGFRKQWRKHRNRMAEHDETVRVVRHNRPEEVSEATQQAFEVSSRSWKAKYGRALTDSPMQLEFYRRLSSEFAPRDNIDLWMLYCGSRPIAFEYHLRYAGVTSPIRADFDEAYAHLSPGAYLEHEILRRLFDEPDGSVIEYNTCGDGYAYERRLTDLVRNHHRSWIFHGGIYGYALRALAALRRPSGSNTSQSVRAIS